MHAFDAASNACHDPPVTTGNARSALHGLSRANSGLQRSKVSSTDLAILQASASVIGDYGERALTIDLVAERAGCSRMTVFRRFGSREELLVATYGRELRLVMETLSEAVACAQSVVDCAEIIVTHFIRSAEQHPIFIRLLRVEPEIVVELSRGVPDFSAHEWGMDLFTHLLSDERLQDPLNPAAAELVGDLLMRLVFSLVLIPSKAMTESVQSRQVYLRRLAEQVVHHADGATPGKNGQA